MDIDSEAQTDLIRAEKGKNDMMTMTRGEITCLNCGRFLGEVERIESTEGEILKHPSFTYRPGRDGVRQTASGLRCSRCNGKAIVGFLERVKRAA